MWIKPSGSSSYTPPSNQSTLNKISENNGMLIFNNQPIANGSNAVTDSSNMFMQMQNLWNTANEVAETLDNTTGAVNGTGGNHSLNFTQVLPNTTYITNTLTQILCYDQNKTFIAAATPYINNDSNAYAPRPFVTPANTAFVRANKPTLSPGDIIFIQGSTLPVNFNYISNTAPDHLYYIDPSKQYLRGTNQDYADWLSRQLSPLYGKKVNFLGDSITNGGYWGQDPGQPNTTVVTYHQDIAQRFNLIAKNYGVGGTGFITTNGVNTFGQRIPSMDADADMVVVYGGFNDRSQPLGTFGDTTTTTIYGAIDDVIKQLQSKFPSKPIFFLIHFDTQDSTFVPIRTALIQMCKKYMIPYCDLSQTILNDNTTSWMVTQYFRNGDPVSQGVHPTTTGHKILARYISRWLIDTLAYL